jgi:hypothetical protein
MALRLRGYLSTTDELDKEISAIVVDASVRQTTSLIRQVLAMALLAEVQPLKRSLSMIGFYVHGLCTSIVDSIFEVLARHEARPRNCDC